MKMNKIQEIITKKILEEASSDELVIIENWRSESIQNENLYQEYSAIWNASAKYSPINFQPNTESAYQKHLNLLSKEDHKVVELDTKKSIHKNKIKPTTKFFTISRIASVAALFVIAFGAMFVFNSMNTTTITSNNGVFFTLLEDGSSIWLDEGSTLSYSSGFGDSHREVKLVGKAFFDVQRNENIEFSISANDINVAVLGTSFSVDTKSGKHIVSVQSGKVAVSADDKEVTLLANEKIVFNNSNFIKQSSASADLAWRNQDLSFSNAPLVQVIADINLFHGNRIVLKNDASRLDCPFTARKLIDTPFDNIIEILKITYDLEVENLDNGNISLSISECK